jgi:hypothetical protein
MSTSRKTKNCLELDEKECDDNKNECHWNRSKGQCEKKHMAASMYSIDTRLPADIANIIWKEFKPYDRLHNWTMNELQFQPVKHFFNSIRKFTGIFDMTIDVDFKSRYDDDDDNVVDNVDQDGNNSDEGGSDEDIGGEIGDEGEASGVTIPFDMRDSFVNKKGECYY